MKVGIVAALPAEVGALTPDPPAVGRLIPLGEHGLLALAGIGPDRAERAARRLLAAGASGLLSWGSAAGLTPALGPGTLVLPERVVAEGNGPLSVDPAWHGRLARALGGKASPGSLAETRRMLRTPAAKQALETATGAVAADMESAAVARIAAQAGVPFAAVRVVTDDAGLGLPPALAAATTPDGDVSKARLLLHTLGHPASLGPLIRLGLRFRQAERTMAAAAKVLESRGWGLPDPWREAPPGPGH
jgi:adenosylhomocysteine nucleosidase